MFQSPLHKRAMETAGPKENSMQAASDSGTAAAVKTVSKSHSLKTELVPSWSTCTQSCRHSSEKNSKLIPEQLLVSATQKTGQLPMIPMESELRLSHAK